MSEELTINPDFENHIPRMKPEEYSQLEANILADGCTDPIILWANHDNTIVDGHNRYKICTEHGVRFKTKVLVFEDADAVRLWILNRHRGRRNLTDEQIRFCCGEEYNQAEKNPGSRSDLNGSTSAQLEQRLSLAEEIGEKYGVSGAQVRRDAKYADTVKELTKPVQNAVLKAEVRTSQRDVAALAELPDDQQVAVIEKVKTRKAKTVKAALEQVEAVVKDPAKITDGTGAEVPAKFRDVFSRVSEFTALERQLQSVVKAIEDKQKDPLFAFLHSQSTVADINNAKRAVRFAKPHAICPYCHGKTCQACKGQGWLPKSIFNQAPDDLK